MNTIKCISEVNLFILNEAMQRKSKFEKRQLFGLAKKQKQIVRVGNRVRQTIRRKADEK